MFSIHTKHLCFYLVYLNFSSATYEEYENALSLCITVTHDRPAAYDTTVQILEESGTAISKFFSTILMHCYYYYMVQINYKLLHGNTHEYIT